MSNKKSNSDNFIIKSKFLFNDKYDYSNVNYFGGQKSFENQIRRDYIKDTYCLDNKISLIRISYLDYDNISNILDLIFYI